MSQKLERKYGLFTAICMVVGIVMGSGVFFKAQTILDKSNGNIPIGVLAWFIGGCIMMVCLMTFSFMAQKYERVKAILHANFQKTYAFHNQRFYPRFAYAPCGISLVKHIYERQSNRRLSRFFGYKLLLASV